MAMFDLASVLKDAAGAQMGTTQEQIEYIALENLENDPNNFYTLSGIEELCANIELVGLQQPLRVRADAENPGKYIIVSGHRRRAALSKLAEDGATQFSSVPCIVEAEASSAELQELRLIYANADTRKISNAELAKQAERIEELLYKLKEQGVDFPGRMRDHVAEVCQVSKSKLQRLKQIQQGLAPDIAKAYYDTGKLNAGAALALSKLEFEAQRFIIDRAKDTPGIEYLAEWSAKDRVTLYERFTGLDCPACSGEKCCNCENIYEKAFNKPGAWPPCKNNDVCCYNCPSIVSCSKSCVRAEPRKAKLKAEVNTQKAEAKERAEAEAAPKIELIRNLWARMAELLGRNKITYSELLKKVDKYLDVTDAEARELLNFPLTAKITDNTKLPFSWGIYEGNIRTLCDFADALGCSLDYLLCHDTPETAKPEDAPFVLKWNSGAPPEPGYYVVQYCDSGFDNEVIVDSAEWDGEEWRVISRYASDVRWICTPED